MKVNKFVAKLVVEEKIKLVEKSEIISKSYSQKSENSLKAGKLLFPQNLLEEATSMIYYAMYNKLISLFFKVGLKCENHSASILLLKELFDLDNELILFAKKERIDKQYYTDFEITTKQVKDLMESAEEFIAEIDFYINKLNFKKIKELRNEFMITYIPNSIS